MIILSVVVSKYYISGVLVDESSLSIIDHFFTVIPYNADLFSSIITNKVLNNYLEKMLSSIKKDINVSEIKKIIISNLHSNVEANYKVDEIVNGDQIVLFNLDYTILENIVGIDNDLINKFQNLKEYRIDLDLNLRNTIDCSLFERQLNSYLDNMLNVKNLFVTLLPLEVKKRSEYIKLFVKNIKNKIKFDCVYNVFFDFDYILIPFLAVVRDLTLVDKKNVEEHIGNAMTTFLNESVKFINLTDDNDVYITSDEKQVKLESNKFHFFDIKGDESLKLMWKSDKSKFNGDITGSKNGICVNIISL